MTTDTLERPAEVSSSKISRIWLAERDFAFATFSVILPAGWEIDQILNPSAWSHVASIFDRTPGTADAPKVGSTIEVRTQDHAFYAVLYVRAVREQALDVQVIHGPIMLGTQAENTSKAFKMRWNAKQRGFDVIRISDNAVVGSAAQLKKKEDALAWIDKMKG